MAFLCVCLGWKYRLGSLVLSLFPSLLLCLIPRSPLYNAPWEPKMLGPQELRFLQSKIFDLIFSSVFKIKWKKKIIFCIQLTIQHKHIQTSRYINTHIHWYDFCRTICMPQNQKRITLTSHLYIVPKKEKKKCVVKSNCNVQPNLFVFAFFILSFWFLLLNLILNN